MTTPSQIYREKVRLERALISPEELVRLSKPCSRCKTEKVLTEFSLCTNGPLGRSSQCRACKSEAYVERKAANPEKLREQGRANSRRNRAKRSVYRVKSCVNKRYGITPEELSGFVGRYLGDNGPVCAACGDECDVVGGVKRAGFKRLVVDHCHETGKLRAMLCDFCNTALGKLRDSPEVVRKLLTYIEGHK